MTTTTCCAECGKEEGGGLASLKACKACMQAKYCNAECQHKHWPKHKKPCKLRAAELRDEALFKDPPLKEDCPICFLPMPAKLISCVTLPPATILSVPIYDLKSNEGLAKQAMEDYYPCCGKRICGGCVYSCWKSGNNKCPFCNSERIGRTEEENVEDVMRRVDANDADAIYLLAGFHHHGKASFQQDRMKAMELYSRAAELGCSKAHINPGMHYYEGGNMKKAKFHFEAAAMAGHEWARHTLGYIEYNSGNMERAIKHWKIGASAGCYQSMQYLRLCFEKGHVSRESIDSTLAAYNTSCAEMRSEARDAYIRMYTSNIGAE